MFFQYFGDLSADRTQHHIAPVVAAALIGAAAKGIQAYGAARSASKATKAKTEQDEKTRLSDIAREESMADPFRHSLAQLNAASQFDQIQNTRQKTVSIPGLNPKYMPRLGGGYQPSQELRDAAGAARTSVLSGQGQAPTMTDSSNYGKTGTMNLIALLAKQGLIDPNDPRVAALLTANSGSAYRTPAESERLPLEMTSTGAGYYS